MGSKTTIDDFAKNVSFASLACSFAQTMDLSVHKESRKAMTITQSGLHFPTNKMDGKHRNTFSAFELKNPILEDRYTPLIFQTNEYYGTVIRSNVSFCSERKVSKNSIYLKQTLEGLDCYFNKTVLNKRVIPFEQSKEDFGSRKIDDIDFTGIDSNHLNKYGIKKISFISTIKTIQDLKTKSNLYTNIFRSDLLLVKNYFVYSDDKTFGLDWKITKYLLVLTVMSNGFLTNEKITGLRVNKYRMGPIIVPIEYMRENFGKMRTFEELYLMHGLSISINISSNKMALWLVVNKFSKEDYCKCEFMKDLKFITKRRRLRVRLNQHI